MTFPVDRKLTYVFSGDFHKQITEFINHKTREFKNLIKFIKFICSINSNGTIRYDTIGEFNVDWKAEYSALSSTRSQKKKLKQPTPVPL